MLSFIAFCWAELGCYHWEVSAFLKGKRGVDLGEGRKWWGLGGGDERMLHCMIQEKKFSLSQSFMAV